MKWVIDVSRWQLLSDEQWRGLIEQGLSGVIIKACSGDYSTDNNMKLHIAAAKKYKIPFGLYQWVDPIFPIAPQVDHFMKIAAAEKPSFVVGDIEQYWSDWQEWNSVVVYKTKPGPFKIFSSEYLFKKYREYILSMVDRAGKAKLPFVAYSSDWFLNSYARGIGAVIQESVQYYWNAAYVNWRSMTNAGAKIDADGNARMSWSEFKKFMEVIVVPYSTRLPTGLRKWSIWQIAEIPFEGYPKLDFNLVRDEDFAALFPYEVATPPPAAPVSTKTVPFQMVVDVDTLNVRSGPGTSFADIGDMKKGEVITVRDIHGENAWVEFGDGYYACVKLGDRRFLKPKQEDGKTGKT